MQEKPKHGIGTAISLLIVPLMLAYPFIIYKFYDELNPKWFVLVLYALFSLRFVLLGKQIIGKQRSANEWLMFFCLSIFCFATFYLESEQLLRFYPFIMNFGMGLLFIVSLRDDECLIYKFAKASGKTPPVQAHRYLRKLNAIWGVLLLLLAAVSAYTAWYTSIGVWTFFNGFLVYCIMATFAIAELIYRGYYKKKHNIVDE